MSRRKWIVELEGGTHTVELRHGYISGKRTIRVDGAVVHDSAKLLDFGGTYPVTIAGHDGYVLIRPIFVTISYDLIVDGRSALTGKSALPPLPLPGWAWLFILACIAVPVITRGAAIPTIIGAGCAMLCVHMVQDSSLSRAARAGGALCITTTCWLLFVMFFARGMFK